MSLGPDYFTAQYAADPDPWGFRSRWYEQRKYALTLAALTRPRYRSAFEPGCSVGVLTAALAQRCDRVLAWDLDPTARAQAAAGTPDNVVVDAGQVPGDWPPGEHDLVVLSEVGYYLDATDLRRLVDLAVGSLARDGELVLVHWRHPVADYPADGDTVHRAFLADSPLHRQVGHLEPDFRLDVLTRQPGSVATREGLC
ncbi:Methyltransferase type 12 [Actinokineospora spheciospongiae]|uniref:Methyltransferase type 12 n=1 Tax=Actinokineospora spheciospongiae TaxID=909613 RepID=W7ID00_9PSEU|nr:SAM-dependent methyltransferase [Actinokineospora spheciospongiae]EWC58680.1 Methyltransferase type 12 [Actinokineospora spheciospongiae]